MAEREKEMADEIITLRLSSVIERLRHGYCPFHSSCAPKEKIDIDCDKMDCDTSCRRLFIALKRKEIKKEVYEKYNFKEEENDVFNVSGKTGAVG